MARQPQLGGDGCDLGERALEVLGDVDRERLQRGDVDDPRDAVDVISAFVCAVETIDADEESGERLARPRRRRDQRVGSGGDVRPPTALGFRRTVRKAAPEPLHHRRMEAREGGVGAWTWVEERKLEPGGGDGHATHSRSSV